MVKPFVDLVGCDLAIFNGRGGLELPDNPRAGCAGVVPTPDCADVQVEIFDVRRRRDEARIDPLYEAILPYIVFAMQTISVAFVNGKRMFTGLAGLENACACRISREPREAFFENAMRRWSSQPCTGIVMSGRRPLIKGSLSAMLRSWVRSCLRPFARRSNSAGPDVVR